VILQWTKTMLQHKDAKSLDNLKREERQPLTVNYFAERHFCKWEIDRIRLTAIKTLGEGQFGKVFLAKLLLYNIDSSSGTNSSRSSRHSPPLPPDSSDPSGRNRLLTNSSGVSDAEEGRLATVRPMATAARQFRFDEIDEGVLVAVKTVKDKHSRSDAMDLEHELEVNKMLEPHPNIVRLLGCCSEKGESRYTVQ